MSARAAPGARARYVSLVPSLTESLFELGVGGEVVGATKFCVHPADRMSGVMRVGGTKNPSMERILGLEPTLVFANEEENRLEDVAALRGHGIEVHTSFPRLVSDVPGMLRDVGTAVGRPEAGAGLALSVEGALAEAAVFSRSRGLRPVRFLVLIWRRPWMGASRDTFLSSLLEAAGGVNVLASEGPRYPELTEDEIADLNPDRVFLPSEPYPFQDQHVDELVRSARIPPGRFLPCDGELLTWHGSRTAAGLRAAMRWLDSESPSTA